MGPLARKIRWRSAALTDFNFGGGGGGGDDDGGGSDVTSALPPVLHPVCVLHKPMKRVFISVCYV